MENNKKIRVLLVDDSFYPEINGVYNVLINYARQINKENECALLVPLVNKKNKYPNKENFNIIYCKSIKGPGGWSISLPHLDRICYKKIKAFKPDIIHIHSPALLGNAAIHYGRKLKVPTIATLHTQFDYDIKVLLGKYNPMVPLTMSAIKKVFSNADASASLSPGAIKMLENKYLYKYALNKPKYLLENATDYVPPKNIDEIINNINKKYNLYNDKHVLIFVGRIMDYKRVFFIADILKILKDKKFEFKMIFVGDGSDFNKLVSYTKKLEIHNNCVFTKTVTDMDLLSGLYSRADLVLFPSTYDNFSLVRLEAAANATPFLATKGALTASGIIDEVNGYISEDSKEAFADKIIKIFKNEKKLKEVGINASKTIYKTWDDLKDTIISTYQKVIADYKNKNN